MLVRIANPAGFEADDSPTASFVAYVDTGIAVAAGNVAIGCGTVYFGFRSNQRGLAVKPNFAVGEFNRSKVQRANAKICQGLVFGLKCAVCRDANRSEEHTSELQSLRHLVC